VGARSTSAALRCFCYWRSARSRGELIGTIPWVYPDHYFGCHLVVTSTSTSP
jgi:hypothetical protein